MRIPQKRKRATVASTEISEELRNSFLDAYETGGYVRWKGHCWQVLGHSEQITPAGLLDDFDLNAVPSDNCR